MTAAPETLIETPAPGVYAGVEMDTYHGWDCASNSRLSRLFKSPAHMRAYIDARQKDTPAYKLGRAVHCAVLEPDSFGDRYAIPQCCGATKKDGKRCTNDGLFEHTQLGWVCGVHIRSNRDGLVESDGAREALSRDDHETCIRIRDAVYAHSMAGPLVTGAGQVEMSMVWEDEDTGVMCKSRWDRHSTEWDSIVDLKTSIDGSLLEFERSLFHYGYHRQAAFYLRGAAARKLPAKHFAVIAVEKEPPYALAVYRFSESVILSLESQLNALLDLYAECAEQGRWPGYPEVVRDIAIPEWGWRRMDEQTDEIKHQLALMRQAA